jgi:membrane protein insertase Oxa1/YidC/SpoIIIJ
MAYDYGWSDFVGNLGVLLLISTFAMLQFDKIDSKGFWYSFNNLVVAMLLMINLYFKPNLSSIIIEVFWILLSIYGLVNYYKSRSREHEDG